MSNISLTDLDRLAVTINDEHRMAETAAHAAIDHALKAGQALIEAKAKIPHGQWESWLAKNCICSARMAQNYMKLCRGWPQIDEAAKTKRVSFLSVRQGLKLLTQGASRRTIDNPRPGRLPKPGHALLGLAPTGELVRFDARDEEFGFYTVYLGNPENTVNFGSRAMRAELLYLAVEKAHPWLDLDDVDWFDEVPWEKLGEEGGHPGNSRYHWLYRPWWYPENANLQLAESEIAMCDRVNHETSEDAP